MPSDYDLLPSFQFLLLKQNCTYFSLERTQQTSSSDTHKKEFFPFSLKHINPLSCSSIFPSPCWQDHLVQCKLNWCLDQLISYWNWDLKSFKSGSGYLYEKIFMTTFILLQHCCLSNWNQGFPPLPLTNQGFNHCL